MVSARKPSECFPPTHLASRATRSSPPARRKDSPNGCSCRSSLHPGRPKTVSGAGLPQEPSGISLSSLAADRPSGSNGHRAQGVRLIVRLPNPLLAECPWDPLSTLASCVFVRTTIHGHPSLPGASRCPPWLERGVRGKSRQTACPKRTPCHHAPIWQPQSRFPVACGRARVGEAPSTLGESREVPSFPLPPRRRGIQGEGVQDTSWAAVPKLRPRNALPPSVVPGRHAADRAGFLKSTHPAPGWRPGRNLPPPAPREGDQGGGLLAGGLPVRWRPGSSAGVAGLAPPRAAWSFGKAAPTAPSAPSSPTLLPRRGRREVPTPSRSREGDQGGGRRASGSAVGSRPGGLGPPVKRRAMP